ncbi:hypothetical protein [Phenylobacterium sp.]|uniref:hypothetical protein n=1 Tax=Phenylobacterium sp. TaxID=1871053 RepID=UPI002B8FEDD8|nr:hypothetical protein [Phenylobacterium sp.]HVI34099.1 hypothetical protein [Phenylobacterium sp.]
MSGYRLYFISRSGRIEGRTDLEATDDAKAIGLAEKQLDGRGVELWAGERLVKKFERAEPKR